MATFHCKLDRRSNRIRKDGSYPLSIIISHKKNTLYLPLGIDLSDSEYFEIFERKSFNTDYANLLAECNSKVEKAKSIFLDFGLESFPEFRMRFYAKNFESLNPAYLSDVLNAYCDDRKNSVAISTLKLYSYGVRVLERFSPKLQLQSIDEKFVFNFEDWFKRQQPGVVGTTKKRNSQASASNVLRTLKALIKYAMKNGYVTDDYRYPFRNYSIKSYRPPKQTLRTEEIKSVIDVIITDKEVQYARDVWVALYRMNGINFIDLMQFRWDQIHAGFLTFTRTKTKRTKRINVKDIFIPINEKVKKVINNIGVGNSPFILGMLEEGFTETYLVNRCKREKKKLNSSLRQLGIELNLSVPLTLSEARNAYANTLKKAGVNLSIIAEQLGHSSVETSEKWYLSSFDKETLMSANDSVL